MLGRAEEGQRRNSRPRPGTLTARWWQWPRLGVATAAAQHPQMLAAPCSRATSFCLWARKRGLQSRGFISNCFICFLELPQPPILTYSQNRPSQRALPRTDHSLIKFHTFQHINHVLIKFLPSYLGLKKSKLGCENVILKARHGEQIKAEAFSLLSAFLGSLP